MAFTSSDLGMELGHGGAHAPKRKRKPSMKKGSEEMDAPSLMKEMAKLHKGKKTSKKATKKKVTKKSHKRHSKHKK